MRVPQRNNDRDPQAAVAGLTTSDATEQPEGWLARNRYFLPASILFLIALIATVGLVLTGSVSPSVSCNLPLTGNGDGPNADLTRQQPTGIALTVPSIAPVTVTTVTTIKGKTTKGGNTGGNGGGSSTTGGNTGGSTDGDGDNDGDGGSSTGNGGSGSGSSDNDGNGKSKDNGNDKSKSKDNGSASDKDKSDKDNASAKAKGDGNGKDK